MKQPSYSIVKLPSRGLETAYLKSGTEGRDLLVFIHGFPDNPHVWQSQIEEFSKKFKVIAPFNRGVIESQSTANHHRYSIVSMAMDVLDLISHEADERANIFLVGHDIGGHIACRVAELLQKKCRGLIMINSLPTQVAASRLKSNLSQLRRSWYLPFVVSPAGRAAAHFFPESSARIVLRLGKSTKKLAHFDPSQVQQARRSYFFVLRNVVNRASKGLVSCSVLYIHGHQDPFILPLKKKELHPKDLQKTSVRIIQGAHWLQQENAAEVNKIIAEFICKSI